MENVALYLIFGFSAVVFLLFSKDGRTWIELFTEFIKAFFSGIKNNKNQIIYWLLFAFLYAFGDFHKGMLSSLFIGMWLGFHYGKSSIRN